MVELFKLIGATPILPQTQDVGDSESDYEEFEEVDADDSGSEETNGALDKHNRHEANKEVLSLQDMVKNMWVRNLVGQAFNR